MKHFFPSLLIALLLHAGSAISQTVSDPSSTMGYDATKSAAICYSCTPGVYLTTDSSDYHPGTTANFVGGGFDSGETVTLQVSYQAGGTPGVPHYAPWTVAADGSGNISATWLLDTSDLGHAFVLTATGSTSSKYSEIKFTDATIANSCFINTDGSYTNFAGNDDGSVGPVSLPFTFQLYGINYTSVYVNNNGNITFGSGFPDYTASGFPITTPMIAPFWADVDTRAGNIVKYKVFPHKMIATWAGVGYYNLHTSPVDSFQVIISDGTDSNVGIGNNVAFYFGKMGWTTGDASGGSGGFGGSPATVGINSGDGTHYIQVGRFGLNSSVYVDNTSTSGVHYLDYTCYSFNVAGSGNIPPSVSGLPGNRDTIACGSTSSFVLNWIGPEPGQSVSTTVDTGNTCNVTVHTSSGFSSVSRDTVSITGTACNVGTHYIVVSATDNLGGVTNDTITIVVLPPVITASSNVTICNGASTTLTASGGASYTWSPSTGLSATTGTSVSANPSSTTTYTVTGVSATGCTNTAMVTVSVNSLPVAYAVNGGGSYCSGGTGVSIGLTNSDAGVNYQLYNGATAVGSAVAGTGAALSFGLHTTAGTYTVVATNATNTCVQNMSGTVVVIINELPEVTASPNVTICNGTATTLKAPGHNALSYTGTNNSYVTIPNTSNVKLNQSNFTVSTWIYTTSTANQDILFHGLGCSTWANWYLGIGAAEADGGTYPGKIVFGFRTANGPGGPAVTSGSNVPTNTWVQVTASYDGSNLKLYLNGNLETTVAASGIPWNSGENLYVGNDPGCGGRLPFSGYIDQLQIWNTTRSATDIAASYNHNVLASTSGLVGSWAFDEASGAATVDSTNGDNGSISGSVGRLMPSTAPIHGNATSYTWTPSASLSASTGASVSASPSVTTTYTVTGTTAAGCSSNASVTVSVNYAPVITACPGNVNVNNATGTCGATVTYSGATATGTPTPTISYSQNSGTTFSVGTTNVTVTASNSCGTANCNFNVAVQDIQNPTITAPANVSANTNSGCTATGVSLGTPTTADNCGVASVTNDHSSSTYPLGSTVVTWTVTDVHGHTATASQNVVVTDNVNPTITAPAAVAATTNSGCSATGVSLGTPVTADNCSVASVTNDHPSTTYPLGTTVVTWTVTDGSGHTATATQNVVVTDNVNPTITAPAAVSATTNSGCSATGVSLGTPATADNCSVASVTNDHTSSTYPLGTTVVTWTVTDGSGNTATATQNVVVTDNVNPTITAPAAVAATTNSGCDATGVSLGTPATADNCSVSSVTNDHSSTTYPLGTTVVTWTVTDGSGNTATATQNVVVTDNVNPTIVAPANVTVYTNSGCEATGVSLGTPSVADNCSVAGYTNDHASTTYPLGTTTVTWTVTDGSGNSATATQTVTVIDNVNPTIIAPANITVNANAGACSATGYSLGTPVTADNCTVASVTSDDAGSYSVGTHTITWTVTDGSGNIATATQTITVVDNQNPTITAPANVTINGWCRSVSLSEAGASLGTPTTADNCGVASVTNNAPSTFTVGTTTVTWTVTDVHGNTATATQTVTVNMATLVLTATATNISCNTANGGNHSDGSIATSISGGTAAYTYAWSNSSTSANPSGLVTGTYSVTVTDAHSCTTTGYATVSQPAALGASLTGTNVSCNSANGGNHSDGSIASSVTGGTSGYSYAWSNGSTSANPGGLSVGSYSVTVTDAHSCTTAGSATISQPSAVAITAISATNTSCNTANSGSHANGTISTTVSGGTGSYSYTWSGGASGANPTGLAIGTYSVTVTDAHSCTTTGSATVGQPSAISIAWTGSSPQYDAAHTGACGSHYFELFGYDASISATSSGGTGTLTYHWSTGTTGTSGTLTVPTTGTAPSSYTVYVSDANSCSTGTIAACVVDVRCATPGNATKTQLCRNGHTICVDDNAVAAQLASGATLGACGSWKLEEDAAFATEIRVYPNPTDGLLNVVIPVENKTAEISIMDVTGRVVTTRTIADNNGSAIQFDLGNVAKGVYLVKVAAGEQSAITKVVVR